MRRITLATAVAAVALVLAGCAPTSGSSSPTQNQTAQPTTQAPEPSHSSQQTPTPSASLAQADFTAGWITKTGVVGIVTHGSSGCVPTTESVTAQDGVAVITLTDGEPRPCTKDSVARITPATIPATVSTEQGLKIKVVYGGSFNDISLPAVELKPGATQEPSAGSVGSGLVGLVTYGSSSCQPRVAMVQKSAAQINVALEPMAADQPCTDDFAMRVTPLTVTPAEGDTLTFADEKGQPTTLSVIVAAG